MAPTDRPRRKLAEYRRKRDFSLTAEPSGEAEPAPAPRRAGAGLRFVVQKHAASHLHYDFRLELDGVMKSWAVPKGPSVDPAQRRLAMEVEDHPISYNRFEGTIPAGEYGGGTVMLWDRGTYAPAEARAGEREAGAVRRGYEKGELRIVMHGERLRGAWTLVRFRPGEKPQWLLIKSRDEDADPSRDITGEHTTSVVTARTMEEIAGGVRGKAKTAKRAKKTAKGAKGAKGATAKRGKRAKAATKSTKGAAKKSGGRSAPAAASVRRPPPQGASATRAPAKAAKSARKRAAKAAKQGATAAALVAGLAPMFATIGREVPREEGWTFEPKYDGIRVVAEIGRERVRLVTRNDKDKAAQFPEVVEALRTLGTKAGVPLVLDGEIIALDAKGRPLRFQELQGRMHVQDATKVAGIAAAAPAALVAFDVLVADGERLLDLPWGERRRRLEKLLRNRTSARLHLTETAPNAGEAMLARARSLGWEGVIAKRMTGRYRPGARTDDWRKLKIEFRQEFVVGGWTEPRRSRQHIGALLLGAFDEDGTFRYVGHAGGGFTVAGLEAMYRRLARLERARSPFAERIVTNERAHWVRPSVVVEVKFSEWTSDGKLRQPIFLGVREDKAAREVTIEAASVQRRGA